jgi:hypothetical protein
MRRNGVLSVSLLRQILCCQRCAETIFQGNEPLGTQCTKLYGFSVTVGEVRKIKLSSDAEIEKLLQLYCLHSFICRGSPVISHRWTQSQLPIDQYGKLLY